MGTGVRRWWVGGGELGSPQPRARPGLPWEEALLLSEPWSKPRGHLVFSPCSPDRACLPPPLP